MDTDAITGYICVTIKIRRRMNFNARGNRNRKIYTRRLILRPVNFLRVARQIEFSYTRDTRFAKQIDPGPSFFLKLRRRVTR